MQFRYLNILLQIVVERYFQSTRCLLIFEDNGFSLSFNTTLPVVRIRVNDDTFDEYIALKYFGCQGILVTAKEPSKILVNIEHMIRHSLERFNNRRYLIVTDRADDSSIFNLTQLEYVADFLFVLEHSQNDKNISTNIWSFEQPYCYTFFTHKFLGESRWNEIIKLDDWCSDEGNFTKNANLYPDKLSDAQGRPFRIATFTYKPYSVPDYHEGTELQTALEFCKAFNLTAVYVVDEAGEWGEIYDNWTGYGILGNVLNDNGDVGLGALYTWAHEYGFLDLSKPVVRTGITCLTPAPKLAAGWLVPLFSFTYDMWIGLALSFIISGIFLAALTYQQFKEEHKLDKNHTPLNILADSFLETAAIFLLQSFSLYNSKSTGKARSFVYGCLFIFSLLMASSYSSGLSSSMTVPRYTGAILTVQELVDSGIQWGATSIAWIMSIMEAPEYNYRVLVERFVKTDGPRLQKYNNKRFAFSVERLPAGQFAIGDYVTEEGASVLRLMHEDIYWEQCVVMSKKSSIWMPQMDEFILLLAQTGIPTVWEYGVATRHLNPKIQRAVAFSNHHHMEQEPGPVKLEWKHVQGAFGIWSFGMILGLLCFLMEIILGKRAF